MKTARNAQAGFTLLEVLVATVVMGIAVAGLIAGLSQSVKNAGRLSDYDRSAMLARTKMNELIPDLSIPYEGSVEGQFEEGGGWRATTRPFESRISEPRAGEVVLEEIALEVWWQPATGTRRTMQVAGYRQRLVPVPAGDSP